MAWRRESWVGAALLFGCASIDQRSPVAIGAPGGDTGRGSDAGARTGAPGAPVEPEAVGSEGTTVTSEGVAVRPPEPPAETAEPALVRAGAERLDFGGVVAGTVATGSVEITSESDVPLAFTVGTRGMDAASFSLVDPCPGPLPPGGSCLFLVRFVGSAVRTYAAELVLEPEAGAPLVIPLGATTIPRSSLALNAPATDFGTLEANAERAEFAWTLTNTGGSATPPLALAASPRAPFGIVENGCTSLEPGASCSVIVSFEPTSAGPFSGTLQLSGGEANASLFMSGNGAHRLTVTTSGLGTVRDAAGVLTCANGTCTGLFGPGGVALSAETLNGGTTFFAGWSPGSCRASRDCTFELSGSLNVTATFPARTNNLIFTSSTLHPPSLGGLAAYDAECNRLATEAGINDASGSAFVAAMSDSAASLRQRLGNARGWVRMDGLPFGDSAASIFDDLRVLYAPSFDERGQPTPAREQAYSGGFGLDPLTGTNPDGSSSPDTCNDWTTRGAGFFVAIARAGGGPRMWINDRLSAGCEAIEPERIVCMGRSRSAPVSVPTFTGKRMWTAFDYSPGTTTPDQHCLTALPAGVASARALVGYTNRPATSVLDPDATYVRTDGALIGSFEDVAGLTVRSSPWLDASGVFNPIGFSVWSGASEPDVIETDPSLNCDDWRSSSATLRGYVGDYGTTSPRWFNTLQIRGCDAALALYCVEE